MSKGIRQLDGKVAVISGAASGIGRALARALANKGCRLALVDVDEPGLTTLQEELSGLNRDRVVSTHVADVADANRMREVAREVATGHRAVHILINNAGITKDGAMKKMKPEQWESVIRVNLTGTFNMARAAMIPMIEQNWGRVVNTASIAVLGNFGQANYSASKAGVVGLTRTMALEVAKHTITVNAVAPGAVDTPMTAQIPPDIKEKMISTIPMKRMAEAHEIASLHAFLCSDEAAYITGQLIFVDGGLGTGA